MTGGKAKRGWRQVLRYTFGVVVCVVIAAAMRAGLQWYWSVWALFVVFMIFIGQRRIFRPSVNRTANQIVCRYIPWYEGNAYFTCLLLPLMGTAAITAVRHSNNAGRLLPAGVILLAVTPLTVFGVVHMWRRSILQISPSTLTLRPATLRSELIEIQREHVVSVNYEAVRNGIRDREFKIEIIHRPDSSDNNTVTSYVFGLQLTVKMVNLLNALTAWKDATDEDPDQLLDRIEYILRDRSLVDV